MNTLIIGSGMAGLLAANMLRRFSPKIIEQQASHPKNHAALLRFRTPKISNATGIPFKKVTVEKAVYSGFPYGSLKSEASIQDQNMYSQKVTGSVLSRSISNLGREDRWIAPDNFTESMSSMVNVQLNTKFDLSMLKDSYKTISTIPMPIMMKIVGWESMPEFKSKSIWAVQWDFAKSGSCNVYQTIYFPEDCHPFYRASITGSKLIIEYVDEPSDVKKDLRSVAEAFGIQFSSFDLDYYLIKEQKYGKILPINESIRKRFILHLTEKYNIYSLGRFATWRQILLDDVADDIVAIENLMENSSSYERSLKINSK